MKSIRSFLRRSLIGGVIIVLGAAATWSYFDAREQIDELFDAQLAQNARMLGRLYQSELASLSPVARQQRLQEMTSGQFSLRPPSLSFADGHEKSPLGHVYEDKLVFQMWDALGQPLLGLSTPSVMLDYLPLPGYAKQHTDHHDWFTFTLYFPDSGIWVTAAQREDVRDELTGQIALHNVLALVVGLLVIALLIGVAVSRGFRPVLRISRQITARQPGYLEPLDASEAPDEIRGMVDALNGLLRRLADTLDKERRFTANAAHELRTPLAGIKVHAQNVEADATDENSRRSARMIVDGVNRMTRVVEQLLTLSRLESGAEVPRSHVDLGHLAHELARDLGPMARQRGVGMSVDVTPDAQLISHENGLYVLLRNLLDNALRYTPEGGEVRLSIRRRETSLGDGLIMEVMDNGPGIPPRERQRVRERFVRLAGQNTSGSGLGLSIVDELAERLGAELTLDDSPLGSAASPGLSARLHFG
ncbi:ATP-binding protein [Cobetia marina]|uniref:ATP-binding protein n=1 Tax=Cobetia marina TaxID=28258 RepID=UPI0026E2B62B|nr:ATP-binding protein [Cobetia marina]MDO6786403.1 ATP-binding protein [Cobetia marina]